MQPRCLRKRRGYIRSQTTLAALEKVVEKPELTERSLRFQVEHVRENSDPARIATLWRSMLEEA
jgi:hypothetical protein